MTGFVTAEFGQLSEEAEQALHDALNKVLSMPEFGVLKAVFHGTHVSCYELHVMGPEASADAPGEGDPVSGT